MLEDTIFAPDIRRNILFVSRLDKDGYSFCFCSGHVSVKYNNSVICTRVENDGLYKLAVNVDFTSSLSCHIIDTIKTTCDLTNSLTNLNSLL